MLILVREMATEKAVQGCLFLNDTFICYTLENAAKAIPTGGYNVENSKSPKFKRELPLLYSNITDRMFFWLSIPQLSPLTSRNFSHYVLLIFPTT